MRRTGRGGLFFRLLLLAVAVLLLAACGPAVHPVEAPLELPGRFTLSGAEPQPGRWWVSFADENLDGLIAQTLEGNRDLQSAWDRLAQAQALARKAGAPLMPTLSAEGSAALTRTWGDGADRDSDNHGLGLAAGYEIDLWGRLRSNREAARFDLQASAGDLRTAAITLTAQVATAWYQLVEQRGQLALLEKQIATNEQVLELVTLRFRTGKTAAADVLQQRQLVETLVGEQAQALGRAELLQHQLAVLSGLPPGGLEGPQAAELPPLPPLPETGLPAELLRRRPDVQSAYLRVAAADQEMAAALADRFPRLSLAAGLDTSGGDAGDLFDNWLANLAANLTGPLIDGGQRRAEVDRTRAVAAERLHSYGQIVLEALGEVEDALVNERRQGETLASLERQYELAGLVVEQVRRRYLNGAENYQRVLDALLSHQQLQRTLLRTRRELIEDRIDLCRALAGGWDMERSAPFSAE